MFKTLMKKQFMELFQNTFVDKKTGKAKSQQRAKGTLILTAALFLYLAFMFYGVAGTLCTAITGLGHDWIYFAIMGLIAMALGVFGSVFSTYSSLYLPKDNEQMLSLPIPPRMLVISRTASVYAMSFLFTAIVWVPAFIRYLGVTKNAAGFIAALLLTFVIAAFVSVLSCILGFIVALIASKTKGKSFVTVILSLLLIGGYYVIYFKVMNSLSEITMFIDTIDETVRTKLHYIYFIGKGATGDWLSFLIALGITAVLVFICLLVLVKTFYRLAVPKGSVEKVKNTKADFTLKKASTALLKREYKHFTALSIWMLNGGLGCVIMVAGAVALAIFGGQVIDKFQLVTSLIPEIGNAIPSIAAAIVCLLVSTNMITAASISLEGDSLWVVQTLPVEPWQILRAKERMGHQLNVIPATLLMIVGGIVLAIKPWNIALAIVIIGVYSAAIQDFGLFLNLRHPNFSWTNEAVVVKQSMPVGISLLGGWLLSAVLGVGGFFLSRPLGAEGSMAVIIVVVAVLWILLRRWLKTKGVAIISEL